MKVFVKWTILFKTELNVDDDGTAHFNYYMKQSTFVPSDIRGKIER